MAIVAKSETDLARQARRAAAIVLTLFTLTGLAALLIWTRPVPRPPLSAAHLLWLLPLALLGVTAKLLNPSLIPIRGYMGERRVLGALRRLSDGHRILNDVTVCDEGRAAQIDHVVVSPFGIWCVETKSHFGVIKGKEADRTWTQIKQAESGKRYRKSFYSPVRQNATHCRRLNGYLRAASGIDEPARSVVVFTAAERIDVETTTPVVRTAKVAQTIRAAEADARLSEEQVEQIVRLLGALPPAAPGPATEADEGCLTRPDTT
jgi:hypothetical protein